MYRDEGQIHGEDKRAKGRTENKRLMDERGSGWERTRQVRMDQDRTK